MDLLYTDTRSYWIVTCYTYKHARILSRPSSRLICHHPSDKHRCDGNKSSLSFQHWTDPNAK